MDFTDLIRSGRRRQLWQPSPTSYKVEYGRAEIERLVPHRDPFLLLDTVTGIDLEQQGACGQRHIAADDPVFAGHFPGDPVYPGALQVEIIGQLSVCLMQFCSRRTHEVGDAQPRRLRALQSHHISFLNEVLPGDQVTALAQLVDANDVTSICAGQLVKKDPVKEEPIICTLAIMEVYFVVE